MKQIGVTLYDTNKAGKVKVWYVSVDGADVVVNSGQEGGKIPERRTTSEGKNLGKASETTPEQQAIKEAFSKHSKKLKEGYVQSKSQMGLSTLPPLAEKYQDKKETVTWEGHYESYKLDGVRMTAFMRDGKVVFQTRQGNEYPVIERIAAVLRGLFFRYNSKMVIDGELYSHGMYLEDIVSCTKKHNKDTDKLDFHVFDAFCPDSPEQPFSHRYLYYKSVLAGSIKDVIGVAQYRVRSEEEFFAFHDKCVSEGFEGAVLRAMNGLFVFNHRTLDFIKYKIQLDAEFNVVGWEQGKNGAVSAVCEVIRKDGTVSTFKAPMKGDLEYQQSIFDISPVGGYITVLFEKLSKYGVPTKTKMKCFRDTDLDGTPMY